MYIESNQHMWGTIKYWCNTIELLIALSACVLTVLILFSGLSGPKSRCNNAVLVWKNKQSFSVDVSCNGVVTSHIMLVPSLIQYQDQFLAGVY